MMNSPLKSLEKGYVRRYLDFKVQSLSTVKRLYRMRVGVFYITVPSSS